MIENELKYVLSLDSQDEIKAHCGAPYLIRQGYLPGKARIRSKWRRGEEDGPAFFFTYKLPVKNVLQEDVVFEIEKDITQHEFDTLWPHTDRRLVKLRYILKLDNVQWDIDYFFDGDRLYFAMAECEMPEDMSAPSSIPDFISTAVVYAVPRGETKTYTSGRIADPSYAKKLAAAIKKPKAKKK